MKNVFRLSGVILLILSILLIHSCKKKEEVPVITTTAVSVITQTIATCGGNVTSDGGAPVTARGVCWGTSVNPTIANSKTTDSTGTFTSSITGLTAGTTYYVRAYATNSVGTGYGNQVSFTTSQITIAALTTTAITPNSQTTATSSGNVTSDGGATVTARGVCWSTSANPTISNSKTTDGAGTGAFTSSITGLTAGTTYYVRAYATNSVGTGYGNQESFVTLQNDQIADIDGNIYNTVKLYYDSGIGTMIWMAENLKTTKYSNGDLIGTTTPATLPINYWQIPKYQWAFQNSNFFYGTENNVATYGRLYTWYAVNDSRNVCPTGWHVSTGSEWTAVTLYLGGTDLARKLHEAGFAALLGGERTFSGGFIYIRFTGYWWSSSRLYGSYWDSSEYSASKAFYWSSNSYVRDNDNKANGFSVRCVKDF